MKSRIHKLNRSQPPAFRAVLVGMELPLNGAVSLSASLDELQDLATTAHYDPVAFISQKLSTINPQTLLGKGKVEELKCTVKHHTADVVIFDEELSPRQTRNLEETLECRVIDRPWLILEIFSDHAQTREAKTQVELARLKYELPRLTRRWRHLSRQRGGIGLREVGETQIQLDRRLIRDQITKLERKLTQIDRGKKTQRKSRRGMFKVALVGYTNVGKSTLMNQLTEANTLVEDKLFATLDSTVRKVKKNFPYPILLADTVGLINKLPHDLVASFKSTLDEVRDADLLLKMVDISHPNYGYQMETVENLLNELGAGEIDSILVFNKIDLINEANLLQDAQNRYPEAVGISCKTGTGIPELRQEIIRCYEKRQVSYRLHLNHSQAKLVSHIRKFALVISEDYREEGITLSLRIPPGGKKKLENLLKQTTPSTAVY